MAMLTRKNGFLMAGLFNFIIIIMSKGFSDNLARIDSLFDFNGCVSICLWGISYIALGESYDKSPLVSLAFASEKLFYVIRWLEFWGSYEGTVGDLVTADWPNIFFLGELRGEGGGWWGGLLGRGE